MDVVDIIRPSIMEHDFISKYHSRYGESGLLARNGTAQILHRHFCSLNADNLDVLCVYTQTLCQVGYG